MNKWQSLFSGAEPRIRDQEGIYFSLSDLTRIPILELKKRVETIKSEPPLHYANVDTLNIEAFESLEDGAIVENLRARQWTTQMSRPK